MISVIVSFEFYTNQQTKMNGEQDFTGIIFCIEKIYPQELKTRFLDISVIKIR